MPFCSFSDQDMMYGITPVENLFIQEYMTRAPGDYVRVYLLGLMLCFYPSESMDMERMAQRLGLEQEAVTNAFRYWEREGAVVRISDRPPAYRYLNLNASMMTDDGRRDDMYKYRELNGRAQALFGSRLLQPHEYQKLHEWIEDLKLDPEVALIMMKSHIEKKKSNKVSFNTLDKIAIKWAESGIDSVKKAEETVLNEDSAHQTAVKVIRQFGLKRAPTVDEIENVRKWREVWGFTEEAIISACSETINATNPSFGYLDKVLSSNRAAPTGGEMDERLSRTRGVRNEVKLVFRALGARAANPTDEQVARYQARLAAGFDREAILMTAEVLSARSRHSIDDLESALDKRAAQGLFTGQQMEQYLAGRRESRARAEAVLEACGLDRRPTDGDMELADAWIRDYGMALTLYAAQLSMGTQTPMRYAGKLLESWKEGGVKDVESAKLAKVAPAKGGDKERELPLSHRYEQREYAEGELDYLFDDDIYKTGSGGGGRT